MKRLLAARGVAFLVFAAAWLLPGCGSSVKLVSVSGKVTVDGEPVTSGQVTLIPDSGEQGTQGLVTGTIDSNGTYKITTNGKDGAPLGKYKVTVNPAMMPGPVDSKGPSMPFPVMYSDSKQSKLAIDVVENPAAGAYDLKMTK